MIVCEIPMIRRIRPQPEHFAELRETLRISAEQFESICHFNNAISDGRIDGDQAIT
jgi:hypothetical protein